MTNVEHDLQVLNKKKEGGKSGKWKVVLKQFVVITTGMAHPLPL